jgi:hypothetical protein
MNTKWVISTRESTEEGLMIQWLEDKRTKIQTMINKAPHRTLKIEQHESGDEPNSIP